MSRYRPQRRLREEERMAEIDSPVIFAVASTMFDVSAQRLSQDHAAYARRIDAALAQFAPGEEG